MDSEVTELKRVMDAAERVKRTGKPGDMDQLEVIMAMDGEFASARGIAIHTLFAWEEKGFVKPAETDDLVEDALKKIHGTDSVACVTDYAISGETLKALDDEKRKRVFKPIHEDQVRVGFSDSQRMEIAEFQKDGTFEGEVFVACIAASKKKIDPGDREMLLKAFPLSQSGDSHRDRFRRLMVKVIEAKSKAK